MSTEPTLSPLVIAMKGEEFIAKLDDGTSLPVKIRLMPLRHVQRTTLLIEQEAELLEFVCVSPDPTNPLPADWIDRLDDESFDTLLRKARSINFQRVAAWIKRQAEVFREFVPLRKLIPNSEISSPTAS